MRFVVIGPARAGKSAFAGCLAEALGTEAVDTSAWIVRVERERQGILAARGGPPAHQGWRWDDARDRPDRRMLIALGDAVCDGDPGFLIRQAFKGGDVICGVRRRAEIAHLDRYVYVVYVDRPGMSAERDNFEIPRESAHVVISNDGTLDDLRRKAESVASGVTPTGKRDPESPLEMLR